MYKRRTWILLLNCRQTPSECLTFFRLTQKKIIADFFLFFEIIFDDFVKYDGWFDDAWNVMVFFLKLYDMLAWMRECMSEICSLFFIFSVFINLRNVGGVMYIHTLWFSFLNLDDDACMDAWMCGWNLLYSKRWITHVCMTWYDVWIFLLHFFENNIRIDSHFIVISNSWSHSTLIFFLLF